MMRKLLRSLLEKGKSVLWWLSRAENILYSLLLLFLPTQFGKHFWPNFSFVLGLRIDYLSPTLYATDILIALVFTSLVIRKFRIKYLDFKFTKKYILFFAFLVFLSLGALVSKSPPAAFYGIFKFLEFSFTAFYTAYFLKGKGSFISLIFLFSAGLVFESAVSIAQFFHQGSLGSILYFLGERTFVSQTPGIANASINGQLILRPYGTFSHPNVLAGYLVLSMTLVLFSIHKRLKYPALFLGTLALFLTLSRIAIIAWVVILCFHVFRKRWKLAMILLASLLLVFYFSPLGTRFILGLTDESIVQRLSLSKAAIDMFVKNPILGVGINNFLINLPFFEKPSGNAFYVQPVHNIFLLILSETGLLGFSIFTIFIYGTYKKILASKEKIGVAFILLSTVLFIGFFDHYFLTLQQGQLLLAFALGVCWSKAATIS